MLRNYNFAQFEFYFSHVRSSAISNFLIHPLITQFTWILPWIIFRSITHGIETFRFYLGIFLRSKLFKMVKLTKSTIHWHRFQYRWFRFSHFSCRSTSCLACDSVRCLFESNIILLNRIKKLKRPTNVLKTFLSASCWNLISNLKFLLLNLRYLLILLALRTTPHRHSTSRLPNGKDVEI
jgi:hypothetical protein